MWRRVEAQIHDTHGGEGSGRRTTGTGEPQPLSLSPFCPALFDIGSDDRDPADELTRLRHGLDEFRAAHSDTVQSTQRLISPLLDLWSLAAAIDHTAAVPIESLLKALVVRTSTTSAELWACADEVEAIVKGFWLPSTRPAEMAGGAEMSVR